MRLRTKITLLAAVAACLTVLAGVLAGEQSAQASSNEPNVILILTDDQTLDEMRALPKTQALIGGAGVTFNRAYISYPLCCPSRVSILSGQYMHNHNVRGNEFPTGGWSRFATNGTEEKALPTWLQSAGYYNVEIGKYMNGYLGDETLPIPPGWDEWYGKLSEYDEFLIGGSIYFNYRLREDPPLTGGVPCPGGDPITPPGQPYNCFYDSQARELPDGRRRRQGRERDPAPQRARVAAEAVLHGRQLQRAALPVRAGAPPRRRVRRRRPAEGHRPEREGHPRQAALPAPPAEARQGQAQPDLRPAPRAPRDAALGRRPGRAHHEHAGLARTS